MNAGAPIRTWWSALQNAERFDHNGMCSLSSLGPDRTAAEIAAGVAPRVKDGPCTHLFVANSSAYLFAQDHSFCCVSSTSKAACHLTRPQASFWNVFDPPTVSDYTSESGYYQGKVKNYTMHLTNPSNFWFWYLTDMHDRPIECEPSLLLFIPFVCDFASLPRACSTKKRGSGRRQGEGPCVRPRGCGGPPKYLFHQYDPATFRPATIAPSVFDVPAVCTGPGVRSCLVEPTFFCTGQPD